MRILGIDPGSLITGYALIRAVGNELQILDINTIQLNRKTPADERIYELFKQLDVVLKLTKPSIVAIEEPFVHARQHKTVLQCAQTAATVMLSVRHFHDLPYQWIPHTWAKKCITGKGNADKYQVHRSLIARFGTQIGTIGIDASDALAVAITLHEHAEKS